MRLGRNGEVTPYYVRVLKGDDPYTGGGIVCVSDDPTLRNFVELFDRAKRFGSMEECQPCELDFPWIERALVDLEEENEECGAST